jgi:3-methyladenine DNA glycosylase AlkD
MERSQLEAQGDEKVRQRYVRDGAGDNVFGLLLGKIRGLAEKLGTNHGLGLELWATGNHEARILACMPFLSCRRSASDDARTLFR